MSDFKVEISELEEYVREDTTTITLDNEYGRYQISTYNDVENINEFKEVVLQPLLLAMGYHSILVDELFGIEVEKNIDTTGSPWFDSTQAPIMGVGSEFNHNGVNRIYVLDANVGENLIALYDDEGVLYNDPILVANIYNITELEWDKITAGNQQFFELISN